MIERVYEYIAQKFEPREGAGDVLLFVAPAGDLKHWAGVPRKAFDYQHGFQRTLQPNRIKGVADFFKDPKNITPTAVVIGLIGDVEIDHVEALMPAHGTLVRLRVKTEDFSAIPLRDLSDRVLQHLRGRLPPETIEAIDADIDFAVAEAVRLEESDIVDENAAEAVEELTEERDGESTRSYLADFYARLLGYTRGRLPWPDETQLREVLYSFLKPAMIVDGQHRVFGAAMADENMLLSVCAVPGATWAESVYQFVVINQKAKPIKPAFLSSIIATSLNSEEIATVYDRLEASKVEVEGASVMERVNTDDASPFKGMIDFQVEGAPGFLQFPGMSALVKDFKAIPRSFPILLEGARWETAQGEWIEHFFAFWQGVRSYFEPLDPRLWQKPTDDNPNNLLKIVSLQEIQKLVLSIWADGRDKKFTDPATTEQWSRNYWSEFPATFFSDEWRKKGLQTTVGRRILQDAITETRRNIGRKGWGHRRLGLFSD